MEYNQTLIIAGPVLPVHLAISKVGQRHIEPNLCVCMCVFFPLIFLRALISLIHSLTQQIHLVSDMFQTLRIQWWPRYTKSSHHGPYVLVGETDNKQSDNSASKGAIFVSRGPFFLSLSLLVPLLSLLLPSCIFCPFLSCGYGEREESHYNSSFSILQAQREVLNLLKSGLVLV